MGNESAMYTIIRALNDFDSCRKLLDIEPKALPAMLKMVDARNEAERREVEHYMKPKGGKVCLARLGLSHSSVYSHRSADGAFQRAQSTVPRLTSIMRGLALPSLLNNVQISMPPLWSIFRPLGAFSLLKPATMGFQLTAACNFFTRNCWRQVISRILKPRLEISRRKLEFLQPRPTSSSLGSCQLDGTRLDDRSISPFGFL